MTEMYDETVIPIEPLPEVEYQCPECTTPLVVEGWSMPGMLTVADLSCPECSTQFHGDFPSGFGIFYPMLLNRDSGEVYTPGYGGTRTGARWYADRFRAYNDRTQKEYNVRTIQNTEPMKPILLNCIDSAYGHCLLKLINAQHHLENHPERDLIVIVPEFLSWMVPEEVAEIWAVDIPLSEGNQWHESLSQHIESRCKQFDTLSLSFAHPNPTPRKMTVDFERFTATDPFPLDKWNPRLEKSPIVTFIWRDDPNRLWAPTTRQEPMNPLSYLDRIAQISEGVISRDPFDLRRKIQKRRVVTLSKRLKDKFPSCDFAVAGPGDPGELPSSVKNLCVSNLNAHNERKLCQRYADSHVVVGVHGSNMLLPTAHAGSVVELVPHHKYHSLLTDVLTRPDEAGNRYDDMFRSQMVPTAAGVSTLTQVVSVLLTRREDKKVLFSDRDKTMSNGPKLMKSNSRVWSSVTEASDSWLRKVNEFFQ